MSENWEEPKEEDGLTLGPEGALQREIEKSKTLKVNLLQLKGEIEKLKIEKSDLTKNNQQLKERLKKLGTTDTFLEKKDSSSLNALVLMLVLSLLFLVWIVSRN